MSADAWWNITYLTTAVIWVATCAWWLRKERRKTHPPSFEVDLRRRQLGREIDESEPIAWRR